MVNQLRICSMFFLIEHRRLDYVNIRVVF